MKKLFYTKEQMLEILRGMCRREGGAKPWGEKQKPTISFSYITAVLRGDAELGKKITDAMGYRKMPRMWVLKKDIKKAEMLFEDEPDVND